MLAGTVTVQSGEMISVEALLAQLKKSESRPLVGGASSETIELIQEESTR